MCGRLRCCLVFEYEQYVEARRQLPRRNKRVGTPHGEGRVLDQFPLRDAVLWKSARAFAKWSSARYYPAGRIP